MGFNKLSENNIQLMEEKKELKAQLSARASEKAAVKKELEKMKTDSNATEFTLKQKIVSAPMFQPRNHGDAGNNQNSAIYRRSVRKRKEVSSCWGRERW